VVSIALPEHKANTPTCRVLAAFNADSESNAPANPMLQQNLSREIGPGISPSHTLRLAALRQDWIMAKTYYERRRLQPGD
jgi:hypothetical protein